jgi:hypothetical protein
VSWLGEGGSRPEACATSPYAGRFMRVFGIALTRATLSPYSESESGFLDVRMLHIATHLSLYFIVKICICSSQMLHRIDTSVR